MFLVYEKLFNLRARFENKFSVYIPTIKLAKPEMNLPENLQYTKDHEWIRVEGDIAYVGITDFAQKELGDIVYVEIETQGQELAQNEIFGTVEAVKTVSDLFLPITATILEVNEKLTSTPELVNSDPYGEGWMVKIAIVDKQELTTLLTANTYSALVGV